MLAARDERLSSRGKIREMRAQKRERAHVHVAKQRHRCEEDVQNCAEASTPEQLLTIGIVQHTPLPGGQITHLEPADPAAMQRQHVLLLLETGR